MRNVTIHILAERVISEVIVVDGCWINNVRTPSKPYSYIEFRGKQKLAHRIVWESVNGPIPRGHHVHHVCENKRCLNINHFELILPGDHMRLHKTIPLCRKHGVPKSQARPCRKCSVDSTARYRARRKLVTL